MRAITLSEYEDRAARVMDAIAASSEQNARAHQEILSKLNDLSSRIEILGGKIVSAPDKTKAEPRLLRVKQIGRRFTWTGLKSAAEAAVQRSYRVQRYSRHGAWRQSFSVSEWMKHFKRQVVAADKAADPVIYAVDPPSAPLPNRRRIMHAIPNVHIGGSTQLIVDILRHQANAFNMHVMTSSFPAVGHHEGIVIHDFSGPTTVESMVVLLREFDPQIIHIHYWGDVDDHWYMKVFEAAAQLAIPVIQNINTPVSPFRYLEDSRIVYVSRYVQDQFPSAVGRAHERVIYPGMDLKKFDTNRTISPDAFDSIGMVYRLEIDKLNLASIDPFIEVVRLRPRTRVFIIGGGSLLEPFRQKVREADMERNFQFTGYVPYDDLPSLYEQFSVFVAPVWKESFGQVAPFAMNMGRAVAGYDIGALSEILRDDSCLADNAADLARIIVGLLDDRKRLVEIGARNRAIASGSFSVEAMVAAYKDLYEEILDGDKEDPLRFFPPSVIFKNGAVNAAA